MKIRFIKTLSTSRALFRRGKEYDLDGDTAREYVNAKVAESVTIAQTKTRPEKANRPTGRNAHNSQ